jgi:esterase
MKLAYREYGQGQPLIIMHGLFGQSDNWNSLAKKFAENNLRVFTIDLRNHGLSPHSNGWSYELMADDLKEFIAEHQLQKPIILGHSMGGKVAMFFELLYPNISSKSIVADIAPRIYEPHHQSVIEALSAVDFNAIENRKDAETIMSQYIADFGTKQFLLKNIYWLDTEPKKMAWRFNLEVITKNILNIGKALISGTSNIKVLFIRGEKSNYVLDSDLELIENHFPNYELVTMQNSGHWLHAENPQLFYEEVMKFISRD